jgi:guanine nucleotide-binding protein G(i) subunit alpha
VSDTVFEVNGSRIHFFDVSGLKHHRKGWISYFDHVHSILFVASLSSYDQNMVEDATINRMSDSLVLFDQMSNHPLLTNIDIILFLNKRDIYSKKVKKVPISKYFPEYQGNL